MGLQFEKKQFKQMSCLAGGASVAGLALVGLQAFTLFGPGGLIPKLETCSAGLTEKNTKLAATQTDLANAQNELGHCTDLYDAQQAQLAAAQADYDNCADLYDDFYDKQQTQTVIRKTTVQTDYDDCANFYDEQQTDLANAQAELAATQTQLAAAQNDYENCADLYDDFYDKQQTQLATAQKNVDVGTLATQGKFDDPSTRGRLLAQRLKGDKRKGKQRRPKRFAEH